MVTSTNDNSASDLHEFTKFVLTLPELRTLFSEDSISVDSSSDYFSAFVTALERRSSVTQVQTRFGVAD